MTTIIKPLWKPVPMPTETMLHLPSKNAKPRQLLVEKEAMPVNAVPSYAQKQVEWCCMRIYVCAERIQVPRDT